MSLIHDVSFDSQTRVLSLLDKAGNVVSSCEVPSKSNVDDVTKPLTFRAIQDGSRVWMGLYNNPSGAFQISRDGGNTWEDYNFGFINLNTGDEVSFRSKVDRTPDHVNNKYFWFLMDGKIEAWHNVMSLYRTNDFATYESMVDYAFHKLFSGCKSLTKAPVLPATTLSTGCYVDMFQNCESLTEAPVLPATTLAQDCYKYMFFGCGNLNKVRCNIPPSYSASDIESKYAYEWLYHVSSTGTFYTNAGANWPSGESGIPENWTRIPKPPVDDQNKPLMLRAIADNSSVSLQKIGTLSNTYQTSTDGTNWTDYTFGTKIILNEGESVYFRCSNHPTTQTLYDYVRFEMTGKIDAWHNAYSMISSDFSSAEESVGDYGMNGLFEYCSALTKAPLLLNALSPYCYIGIFLGTSLTQAPVLPATTLAEGCYMAMFSSCVSLTQAPVLPVTTLAKKCYSIMFSDCDSLTQAPALPATALAEECYSSMFRLCDSLTKAPALPAATLAEGCYKNMFWKCPKLKEVRISATKTATNALKDWLSEVAARGNFYCDPNATIFPSGASGIPQNWTRLNINDYPTT